MSNKRSHIDIDPDYEDVTDQQAKRQRVLEKDAKESAIRKIESIIRAQFEVEIRHKEAEISVADQRLNQSRLVVDRLRACIVACHYSSSIPGSKDKSQPPSIHPTVKARLGKAPATVTSSAAHDGERETGTDVRPQDQLMGNEEAPAGADASSSDKQVQSVPPSVLLSPDKIVDTRGARFKIKKKIIVGNISKFIPLEHREVNDQSTHKWMVYVRGPKDKPNIDTFVKKVWFFLHPSYKPNDLVEITQPPYHLTRRGWGEFPVRVQLHFHDTRNKRVDVIHNLKLDKTCTGLQTLGSETIVEIELEREIPQSEIPLPLSSDSGSLHNKGDNCSDNANTTIENQPDNSVFSTGDGLRTEVSMETDTENSVKSNSVKTEVGNTNGNEDNCIQNGAQEVNSPINLKVNGKAAMVPKSNITTNNTPKVIHLKTKGLLHSDLITSPKGKDNHSKVSPTSAELVPQPGVMYMRCKDQQGNLLLLPYKLGPTHGPGTPEPDPSALNKSPATPTSTPAKTSGSVSIPQPNAITPSTKTTNLVLKVTPTGLKLVPAESESSTTSVAKPTHILQGSEVSGKPKLKSLLNAGSFVPNTNSVLQQKGAGGVKPGILKPSNTAVNSLLSKSQLNLKLSNHTVPNPTSKMPPPPSDTKSNQSLVLANIGDRQILLKVIPGADNQVLLVPNQPSCTQQTGQPTGTAKTPTIQPQKSLLASTLTNPTTQHMGQKSLTFSFGSSPFSMQSAHQRADATHSTSQKQCSSFDPEKKIHVWKKKIRDLAGFSEEILPLRLLDYPDLLSIIRAAVRRHPVVREVVDRSLHPYCAQSTEEWLSWNVGKRRASEWQRAASVRTFILDHLKEESSFKGEQLWTTKQIMTWCRLHAFSPHHLENTGQVDGVPNTSVSESMSQKHTPETPATQPLTSLSDHEPYMDQVDTLLEQVAPSDDSEESDLDIVSVDLPRVKLKEEPPVERESHHGNSEVIPPSDEAVFVQDIAQQIGVRFQPAQIQPGVAASVVEDTIYTVMSRLAEDIVRETFSVANLESNSTVEELSAGNVFKALNNMALTDFLTNKHLGIHDNTAPPSGVR